MDSPPISSLVQLLDQGWKTLEEGSQNRKSSFRTLTLGTTENGLAELRTITLRGVSRPDGTLWFNADVRSPKVAAMRRCPRVSLCGYGVRERVQIRLRGEAEMVTAGPLKLASWAATELLARRCYLAPYAPSVPQSEFHPNLPAYLVDREPIEAETPEGLANFSVVRIHLTEMDIMVTHFTGHRRALFRKEDEWRGTWLTA